MAIQKDITDNKGVKTRYHKLDKFVACDDSITANIKSYTNASVRDAEKQAINNNKRAIAYDAEIQRRNRLYDSQLHCQQTPASRPLPDLPGNAHNESRPDERLSGLHYVCPCLQKAVRDSTNAAVIIFLFHRGILLAGLRGSLLPEHGSYPV